jgi:hypothetical protein
MVISYHIITSLPYSLRYPNIIHKHYIYLYDENTLAVDVGSVKVASKMARVMKDKLSLFVERDDGAVFLFDPRHFKEVDSFIRLRRRRQLNERQREILDRGRLKGLKILLDKGKFGAQI